jgi:hypothetical protein
MNRGFLVFNAELASDELSNPIDGPAIRIKTMATSALLEQAQHARVFSGLQPCWPTRREANLQSIIPKLVAGFAPAHNRARSNIQDAADLMHRESGIEEGKATSSTLLKIFC